MAAFALLVIIVLGCGRAASTTPVPTSVGLPAGFHGATVAMSQLPAEARATLDRIAAGGPFRYAQDDSVFGNREGLLPARPSGYYREYTVVTPGSIDRGARRIVAGAAGERYYTDDHYASFRFIVGDGATSSWVTERPVAERGG